MIDCYYESKALKEATAARAAAAGALGLNPHPLSWINVVNSNLHWKPTVEHEGKQSPK